MRKRISTFVALMLALVGIPKLAYAHEGHAALPTKGLTVDGNQLLLSEGARKVIDLQTEKVYLDDIQRVVTCNARVELSWRQQAIVTTQVPGRIAQVMIRPGELVEAGQKLASVESLELEKLQLAMLQADAELALAKEQLSRHTSLADQGVIAGKTAIETRSTVRQKNAELEIAMCKLRALGLAQSHLDQIRQTTKPITEFAIVSPISGILADAEVRIGQLVKTTEHLFHVVDLSTVWVLGDVLEGDVSQVQVGQPVVVRFKSLGEAAFSGRIDHLHLRMNDKRRTRAAAVALDNSAGRLRPGMFGQMEIEVGRSKEAIICPNEGIIQYFGQQFVLLNRGKSKYIRQPIRTGVDGGDCTEILDGLFPGDQIVVNGKHVLFSLFGKDASTEALEKATSRSLETPNSIGDGSPVSSLAPKPIVIQGIVELPTDRKAFVASRIEGRVARIWVVHSQAVRAGDVLAEVESLELRNLQGELLENQAKLMWTAERVRRLESFAKQNITSKKELWQLQTNERVLQNKVASLTRTLTMVGVPEAEIARVLQTDLSKEDCDLTLVRSIPIVAPTEGKVAAFEIVPGQIVDAQDTLFEMHDASKVWVKGYVFQRNAGNVQIGQRVKVTFHALPRTVVQGKIVRVSPVLNESERVLPLWVEVDNSDGHLIEGMLARVEIASVLPSPIPGTQSASAR